jgi:hypothetical protein
MTTKLPYLHMAKNDEPNGCKMFQIGIKYVYQHVPFQGPPKYTQFAIFVMAIPSGNHALSFLHWDPY